MVQEYKVLVYDEQAEWFNMEGQIHRIGGPALECSDGTKSWWVKGKLHRLDGPAVEGSNGKKEWWIEGKQLTEEEFNRKVTPIQELTVEEISQRLGYEVKIVKS